MSSLRLNFYMVIGSVLLYLVALLVNELLFSRTEFVWGINWIYLPAGIRLLCTLLFGGAGAIGILIASWIACVFYYFPDDPLRSFVGGIASATGPYLTYKLAQHMYGMQASLMNLSAKRLLLLVVAYSLASPSLHHLWFWLQGDAVGPGFFIMVLGDLLGALLIIYAIKYALSLLPVRAVQS